MDKHTKRKVIAGSAAALAVAGGGAAIAASKLESPGQRSQAIVDDAAQQLGIPATKLSDALKKALEDQLDAEVTAGRLTQTQANELKQRIESGDFPIFGGPGPGFHHGGPFGRDDFTVAANYVGLAETDLRTQLESGKTLAQVATAQGKTADGLIQALVDAELKEHPDASAADLKQRYADLVNGTFPARPFHHADSNGGPPTF
jgi:hypothetical protein